MRILSMLIIAALVLCMGCASGTESPESSESAVASQVDDTLASSDMDIADSSSTLDRLQGTWQSTEDPDYIVQFQDDRFIESYTEEATSNEPVRIVNECPERPSGADSVYFLVGDICYAIVDLTTSSLSYSMVGGRGNTLAFKRSDALE